MIEELKPCPLPWCESKRPPRLLDELPGRGYAPVEFAAGCDECDIFTPQFATAAEAVACWNTDTRSPPAKPAPADGMRLIDWEAVSQEIYEEMGSPSEGGPGADVVRNAVVRALSTAQGEGA